MSNTNSEPPENWQRVLAAAKTSKKTEPPADTSSSRADSPTKEFSNNLLGRVRSFHASLAAWQRWTLIAGIASVLLFVASLIYLKVFANPETSTPIIETPGIDLPEPSPPTNN